MSLQTVGLIGVAILFLAVILLIWALCKSSKENQELEMECVRYRAKLDSLKEQIRQLETEKLNLATSLTKTQAHSIEFQKRADLELAHSKWCDTTLLPLPPDTPERLHNNTLNFKNSLLVTPRSLSLYELHKRDNFSMPTSWELYWCLTHAAQTAIAHSKILVENAITEQFVQELKKQVQQLPSTTGNVRRSLNIAYSAIYSSAAPSLKEADVGADLLLIVAGTGLVSGGGARLLWIQAKKAAASANAYTLDCSYSNTKVVQLDELRKVNVPEKGSLAAYIQYSSKLMFIPALALSLYPEQHSGNSINLSEHGVRFQELATALLSLPVVGLGSFQKPRDVINFIKNAGKNKPLYVVGLTEGGYGRWNEKDIVNQVVSHYRGELGLSNLNKKSQEGGIGIEL
ncbi:hypothetical protein [Oxalicibacterium faecigallinarum]|uniref:Uncharacterized protein n=1 Tax=Oxalicibacterium faecigallinarum TaxID=573741 RepID=A0A8J3EZH3_9BURK|nr:hypothetical protein [Oxalicibacterium faecigallinarum]GGI16985.1 hypothetical protein GCM10008066_06700 [Oxalicibacterium faecigallinarum]